MSGGRRVCEEPWKNSKLTRPDGRIPGFHRAGLKGRSLAAATQSPMPTILMLPCLDLYLRFK
jgi:hypothetical protein